MRSMTDRLAQDERSEGLGIGAVFRDPGLTPKFYEAGFFYGDLEGGTGFTSRALREIGFSDVEMRNGGYRRRMHPDDVTTYTRLFDRVNGGLQDELYCEYRLADGEGEWHWIQTHAVVMERQADGSIGKILGTDRDITSRKAAEEYLSQEFHETRRKYEIAESLRQTSTIVSSDLDLTNSLGLAIGRLATIVRFDRCEVFSIEGRSVSLLYRYPAADGEFAVEPEDIHEELARSTYPIIRDDVAGRSPFPSWLAVPLRVADRLVGAAFLLHRCPGFYSGADLYPVMDFAEILAVAIHNNQYLRRTISELETDELTGFLTRRRFDRDSDRLWQDCTRIRGTSAVAMIDIDHFKRINDNHGHPAGDEVIRRIADVVRSNLRRPDTLARYGGEEFLVLLPSADAELARNVMDRIRVACARLEYPAVGEAVTVSVGIATGGPADALTAVIARADDALYRAKRLGRNRVETS